MLRVLHIGKYFPPFSGGIENFMADLLPATQQLDVDVAAIVHRHDGREHPVNKLPVWRVPTRGELIHAPVSPAFRVHLIRAIREWRPDLLHIHMPNTSAFWALSLRGLDMPWVVHWHADVLGPGVRPALRVAYQGYRLLESALLRRAAAIIATSPGYLDSSRPLAPWRAKCSVIPLGLRVPDGDPGGAVPPPGAWPIPDALHILAVGRLSAYKGLDHLLRAMRSLPGVDLVIAGDGEQGRRLRHLAVELGVTDRVRMLGRVADDVRDQLIGACDLLCLPSVNRNEAFGLVLLEAMAQSKPALVTRVPGTGMPWVVEDGVTGWHVAPASDDALARALAAIRDDRSQLVALGRNARQRFAAEFAIDAVAARTVSLYRRVLQSAAGRR